MLEHHQPGYRAQQVREQARLGRVAGFEAMAVLPQRLREMLSSEVSYLSLSPAGDRGADLGLTHKLLLRAHDGQEVETVAIRHPGSSRGRARHTVCVSSQVGCAIGCVFCATGQLGLRRQLSAAEIVDQVRIVAALWANSGAGPPSNVVFMGMGEPLHNYQAVVRSLRLLREWGISWRRIVVSTSGLVPEIDRLAGEGLPVTLAISLHAAEDRLRDRLVPLNRRFPLADLEAAASRYRARTGRRVSLEYVLIAGVNDSAQDAAQLRRLADRIEAHVNLIPMNPIPHSQLGAPPEAACRDFATRIGPRATIRFSRGRQADAACGQLRAALLAPPQRLARRAQAPPVPPPRPPVPAGANSTDE